MFIINYITKYHYYLLSDFMRPIIIETISLPFVSSFEYSDSLIHFILLSFQFFCFPFELSALSFELITSVVSRLSKSPMTHPLNHFILKFFSDRCEIGIIAGYSDQQMTIVRRVFLGITQHIRIQHIDL